MSAEANQILESQYIAGQVADALRPHVTDESVPLIAQNLASRFVAGVGVDGQPAVVARSGKSVKDEVAAVVAGNEYQPFRRPPEDANVAALRAAVAGQLAAPVDHVGLVAGPRSAPQSSRVLGY